MLQDLYVFSKVYLLELMVLDNQCNAAKMRKLFESSGWRERSRYSMDWKELSGPLMSRDQILSTIQTPLQAV
jgi:hypothetical protein